MVKTPRRHYKLLRPELDVQLYNAESSSVSLRGLPRRSPRSASKLERERLAEDIKFMDTPPSPPQSEGIFFNY